MRTRCRRASCGARSSSQRARRFCARRVWRPGAHADDGRGGGRAVPRPRGARWCEALPAELLEQIVRRANAAMAREAEGALELAPPPLERCLRVQATPLSPRVAATLLLCALPPCAPRAAITPSCHASVVSAHILRGLRETVWCNKRSSIARRHRDQHAAPSKRIDPVLHTRASSRATEIVIPAVRSAQL